MFLDWSQDWDLLQSNEEAPFMWSLWHKAMVVNEGRDGIMPTSISKQCFHGLPNTRKLVKHKFFKSIQARRAWPWATFIMHKLCGVRIGNYDIFPWKQAIFGEKIPHKIVKNIKIWCLLCGITIWTIWIEHNDKVFNQEQWHQSKVIHLIWADLIICTPKWLRRGG